MKQGTGKGRNKGERSAATDKVRVMIKDEIRTGFKKRTRSI